MYTRGVRKQCSVADARARLPALIDEVEAGGQVELTRRGRPVAVLISRHQLDRLQTDRPDFREAYRLFLRRFSLDEIGAESGDFESLRDRTPGRRVRL